jgi:transposase
MRVPLYPPDMSDAERAITEVTLPESAWQQGRGGRPAKRCRRDIVDAIRYLVKEGIQWRAMPADLPHWRTVYDYADGWQKTGATEHIHAELREQSGSRRAARRSRRPRLPAPSPSKRPGPSARTAADMTRARRSTAASGTSPPAPSGCCSPC